MLLRPALSVVSGQTMRPLISRTIQGLRVNSVSSFSSNAAQHLSARAPSLPRTEGLLKPVSSAGAPTGAHPRTARTLQQQYNANKLFEMGQTKLYRSPKSVAYTLSCYTLGAACLSCTSFMALTEMWREDPESGLAWFVPVSYRLSMLFLSFLGWWVVWQSRGQVKALDLVWRDGRAKMLVTMRKKFPNRFLKPKQLVSEVVEVTLPLKVISQGPLALQAAKDEQTPITQRLTGTMLNFFVGTRRIFTGDGFLLTTVKGEPGYKIDAYGSFQNDGRDLLAVASQEIV